MLGPFLLITVLILLSIIILVSALLTKPNKVIQIKFIFSGDGVTIEDADQIKNLNWISKSTEFRFIDYYLSHHYELNIDKGFNRDENLINCKLKKNWSHQFYVDEYCINVVVEFVDQVYL